MTNRSSDWLIRKHRNHSLLPPRGLFSRHFLNLFLERISPIEQDIEPMTWKELRVGGLNEFQRPFWFDEILLQSVLDSLWNETVLHSSRIGTKRWRHNPLENFVIIMQLTSRNDRYFEIANYPKSSSPRKSGQNCWHWPLMTFEKIFCQSCPSCARWKVFYRSNRINWHRSATRSDQDSSRHLIGRPIRSN